MDIVFLFHSLMRYVVLLVAVIGLGITIFNIISKDAFAEYDSTIATIFLGSFDLQAFLGVLIIFLGGMGGPLHPLAMFVALVVAHALSGMIRQKRDGNVNSLRLTFYLLPLAIILSALFIIGQLRF